MTQIPHSDFVCNQIMDGLDVAVYTCNPQGQITFYNRAAADLWGREPELGRDKWCGSLKIYYPDGSPMAPDECPMAIALKEYKAVLGREIIVERPDGMRRHVQPHPRPLFDEEGVFNGAVNMLIDITDLAASDRQVNHTFEDYANILERRVEEHASDLLKSEERYYKMIEEVQDYAIILLDKDGTILNWNIGAERIKGYKQEEIVGKNFRVFYLPEDRERGLPDKLINEAVKNDRAMHEGWRLRKDGTKFWGSIVITALHDDNRNIIGFSKVTRDLTDRKIAEDKLKEYSIELEHKNKELEQFAYIASHDLQAPLRKIQTFSSLLERNLSSPEMAKAYIDKINTAAQRMTTLIHDILQYTKVANPHGIFREVSLNDILEHVIADYDVHISEKHAVVKHSELPVIRGNYIQLYQLFANLLSNSLKYSEKAPFVQIMHETPTSEDLFKHGLDPERAYVLIHFKDNGIGFDQEYAEKAFQLFQRLTDSNAGTGIGLALCKKVVENHNGLIGAESHVGEGTIIHIYLPVSDI